MCVRPPDLDPDPRVRPPDLDPDPGVRPPDLDLPWEPHFFQSTNADKRRERSRAQNILFNNLRLGKIAAPTLEGTS